MDNTVQLREQFESAVKEHEKFMKGNSAAGTRARKALGELAKVCKSLRAEIAAEKAARKAEKEQAK